MEGGISVLTVKRLKMGYLSVRGAEKGLLWMM